MTEPADKCIGYTKSGLRIIGTTPEGWDIVDMDDILNYLDYADINDIDPNWTSVFSDEELNEIAGAAERNCLRKYKYGSVRIVGE